MSVSRNREGGGDAQAADADAAELPVGRALHHVLPVLDRLVLAAAAGRLLLGRVPAARRQHREVQERRQGAGRRQALTLVVALEFHHFNQF